MMIANVIWISIMMCYVCYVEKMSLGYAYVMPCLWLM